MKTTNFNQFGATRLGISGQHQWATNWWDVIAVAGCGSGVDWRRWDGTPCGDEGLLSDQFGILAIAHKRYGKTHL